MIVQAFMGSVNQQLVTEQDLPGLFKRIDENLPPFYAATIEPLKTKIIEIDKRIAGAREMQAQGKEMQAQAAEMRARGNEMQARGNEMQARGNEMQARGNEMQARGNEMQARGNEMQVRGNEMQARGWQNIQCILTKIFFEIFNGKKPLPTEEMSGLFVTYLASGDLTYENVQGNCYPKINFMSAVMDYLNDHTDIKKCDFRAFKNEVYDVQSLAAYLSKPSCRIRAIAFKNSISAEAKAELAMAVEERKGDLEVKYYP